MAAGKLDIYIEQGSSFNYKLTFKDSLGAPIDLTGQTFAGQIRRGAGDPTIIATFTCGILNQITNTGEMTFSLTAAQTSLIPLEPLSEPAKVTTQFAYDLERTLPGGTVERVIEGLATVSPEVTV